MLIYKINHEFGTTLNNAQLTHPLASGMHDSNHAYMLTADVHLVGLC